MSPNGTLERDLIDIGNLKVSVVDETRSRPIDNATVKILDPEQEQLIEEIRTDSSGQAGVLELQAPPLEYSMTPNGLKPYAEYTLEVSAQDFNTTIVEGVQLLPNTTAIQRVRLQEGVVQQQFINIPQHTLWGTFPPKIPEPEVKPLPEGEGFVVLPEPVIPEYVIVHLGRPSDTSARNVWIPFTDYVKNVASCEIYATWPKSTLRANILAIISFVLNRVYTEWYRGKGFDFTITNSTAFDQAFVYGRNYFDDISIIVDEIFTQYVTRPGIRQPLLTQFCDGSRVRCPNGLEQWGSKNLGEQGFDALSILRNYYGANIYLATAQKVQGVPMSFPGYVLEIGSTGAPVRTIQQQLNAISDSYPAIKKIRVDGIYGEDTANAVRTFQSIFDIPESGKVDFATWYQISNIYVAVEKLAE